MQKLLGKEQCFLLTVFLLKVTLTVFFFFWLSFMLLSDLLV